MKPNTTRPPARHTLLGLPVDALTLDEAVTRVSAQIESARHLRQRQAARSTSDTVNDTSTAEHATPTPADSLHPMEGFAAASLWQVVTLNPEIAMQARRDPLLRAIIRAAPLVTADGIGIVWALWLRGVRLPARVTGIDLLEALASRSASSGYQLFLLGASPGVAKQAGEALLRRYPGLQ